MYIKIYELTKTVNKKDEGNTIVNYQQHECVETLEFENYVQLEYILMILSSTFISIKNEKRAIYEMKIE